MRHKGLLKNRSYESFHVTKFIKNVTVIEIKLCLPKYEVPTVELK
jgi:hypothetical protein